MSSKIKINVKGKNVERFIKRLNKNKIDLLKIEYIKYDEINIIVYYKDYEKIVNLKTIYEVKIINIYGIIKLRKNINDFKYLIFFLIIGVIILITLSKLIFKVEVIHNDKKTRNLVMSELESLGIKKYRFKKNYDELQKIKLIILKKHNFEWIEIEELGTKYIVRLESRIYNDNNKLKEYNDVIAKKSGILKKIVLEKGNVVKNINDYVNKGDVVISGSIYLNDKLKDIVSAQGKIYGEVWYNVKVEFPFVYNEVKELNNFRNVYLIKLFNKEIGFNLNKYKDKKVNNEIILENKYLPIYLIKQHQQELKNISFILNKDEVLNKAIDYAKNKLNLKKDEKILDYKIINYFYEKDKIVLNLFFTVYENITDYKKIESDNNVS